MDPVLVDDAGAAPLGFTWPTRPKFQNRVWLHALLFVLTIGTTTLAGAMHYAAFLSDFRSDPLQISGWSLILHGFWYSGTILAILGCHELGHYLACRYYDVDASMPFFLPFLLPFSILQTGTLGAFIRIREPIPQKRMLFDIGVAGPIAGFLVAVPTLFIGIAMSHVVQLPNPLPPLTSELGEPLLFKIASWVFWGSPPDGYTLNMHPMAFGAWFGLLATALNLFPIGQLDGGHISYAVLGQKSTYVTFLTIGAAIALAAFFSPSWVVWTGLTVVMLFMFGPRHPRVFDEHVPLDRTRIILAVFALVMFILCFTPAPIQSVEALGR